MRQTIKVVLGADHVEGRAYPLQRLEELFDFRYSSQILCENWEVEHWLKKQCAKAQQKRRIDPFTIWLGTFHGAHIDQETIPDITIRWINPQIGYGLFTNISLPPWHYIGEYTGLLRRRPLLSPKINDYCFMYPKEWRSWKSFTIDSGKQGNYTRFINHSPTPNCESIAVFYNGLFHIIFRTLQAIPAGTQLTYDYGDIYWKTRPLPCLVD